MPGGQQYEFGPFRLDGGARLLFRDGERTTLTPKAVEVLLALVEARGKLVGKEELLQKIWADATVEEGTLTYHVSLLRKALGGGPQGQQFIETIPKRGYCFVAPVRVVTSDSDLPAPAEAARPVRSRAAWWWAVAVVAVVIVSGTLYFYWRQPSPPPRVTRVLVLPVENLSGDPEHDYVSDGLTEELIAQLSALGASHVAVIARTSAMSYKGTSKTVGQISDELGVDYVLESSLRWSGSRLRITSQLVRGHDQLPVWSRTYDRTPKDMLLLEDEVAKAIALEIHASLGGRPQPRPPLAEAYLPYLEGRYYWNKRTRESVERAMVHLRQAIALDPNYARAHAALADCYMSLGLLAGGGQPGELFSQAKASALKALSLDDNLAEAHTSLAYLRFWQDWDWPGAESEFRRAIALNPDYATAHQWYAEYLRLMGRFDESIAESNKALELDPLSLVINMEAGLPYYLRHENDKALEHFQKAVTLDPNFALAYVELGWVYEQTGEYQRAIGALEKAAQLDDTSAVLASLGGVYATAGRTAEAKGMLSKLEQRSRTSYVSPFLLAVIYRSLGDDQRALDLLDQAYERRDWALVWLKVGPKWDPLRSNPRFIAIVHRMNFPETTTHS